MSGFAGDDINSFEDCDGLGWGLYTPIENSTDGENRKSLFASDSEGKDSLIFYLKD